MIEGRGHDAGDRRIRLGMVGGGQGAFIGAVHRIAARLDNHYVLVAGALSSDPERARASALELGIAPDRAYHDFAAMARAESAREDGIEAVAIVTPNNLHAPVATAFLKAGIHVICDKPLATSVAEARELARLAKESGKLFAVTYNYTGYPLIRHARAMVAAGELGDITGFRGVHAEDYMADPEIPYGWRVDPSGGGGAIADIGSHIIGMARFLVGPISEVIADLETVIKTRPMAPGSADRRAVEVDDIARLNVRFARGCGGTIEANWVATGRKMQLGFELTGTKGSLAYSQERMNELLFYRSGGDPRHHGFTRIEAGAQHPPYGLFCPAPGHQLGFNDLKTIEVAEFLGAIAGGERHGPDFREAWEIQRTIDTAIESSRTRRWRTIGA